MKKVVICASVSFHNEAEQWKKTLEKLGYKVIRTIQNLKSNSIEEYKITHTDHYKKISESDLLLILNLDKKGIKNYIGPSVFAEIAFAIGLNLALEKKINVYLLNPLPKNLPSSPELNLWLKLGWIEVWPKH